MSTVATAMPRSRTTVESPTITAIFTLSNMTTISTISNRTIVSTISSKATKATIARIDCHGTFFYNFLAFDENDGIAYHFLREQMRNI
ncbi:hypothetical protein CHS0354_018778 [Potamilus streckersoni]|uniref:Uncharacterized protein n=1 Tax=Potamilus streckersoni TaxID=2493646 RepID=A0AAE0TBF2_9BIVA|nr:hypothetical protein CHS0354_018778 [Potamilus streckersoni]